MIWLKAYTILGFTVTIFPQVKSFKKDMTLKHPGNLTLSYMLKM
jgi:hypothetical protein